MKAILSDMEARTLCRMPKPTPQAIKKVIEWGKTSSAPEKIAPLLILQTNNYASRKGFDELLQQALVACAQQDQSLLWEVIERDWEPYRVLHALRALAAVGGKNNMQRLIGLGMTPILRIHWEVIQEAAQEAGIAIPQDVIEMQKVFEAQRGNSDFYEHFNARKSDWPSERDQVAKPVENKSSLPTKKSAPAFPAVFSAEREQNRFLKQYKSTLGRRLTFTRMEGLFEEVDLAFYLTALGRTDEALQLLTFLTGNIEFNNNYNVWTPVGYGISLQARLHRLIGDTHSAQTALERIRAHPFQVPLPREQLSEKFAVFQSELAVTAREKSSKWACQKLSRTLCTICYYLETGVADFPNSDWYPINELETLMKNGLQILYERLQSSNDDAVQ